MNKPEINQPGIIKPALEKADDGRLRLSGELSFQTVPLLIASNQYLFADDFDTGCELNIDLDQVSRADSAGVALLIEWQRQARQKNRAIYFHNIPSKMLAIARLSGVDEILSLK